jgi:hypothetical protein
VAQVVVARSVLPNKPLKLTAAGFSQSSGFSPTRCMVGWSAAAAERPSVRRRQDFGGSMRSRIWQVLTDEILGAKAFIVLFLSLLLFVLFRISGGRERCQELCEAKGYPGTVIYEPSRLANAYEASCSCRTESGELVR